ncbi:hypothetical protein SAMN05421813_13815 [Daejeonella rubra]|uniref:Uncharacterized protein n=1 Tax=Daejeonella rubra TaxID=990371 RepID=A0A1G9YEB2_9SPHI|nr:hypothetical protein SAMN05421813_13815 [Daejeonella rubra]
MDVLKQVMRHDAVRLLRKRNDLPDADFTVNSVNA